MKEKTLKNGCDILIIIFTNLEKYVYSKNCLKQRRQPPPPLPPAKSKVFFAPKSHLTTEEQPSEEGKLQIFFFIAKIISFLIRHSSVR